MEGQRNPQYGHEFTSSIADRPSLVMQTLSCLYRDKTKSKVPKQTAEVWNEYYTGMSWLFNPILESFLRWWIKEEGTQHFS